MSLKNEEKMFKIIEIDKNRSIFEIEDPAQADFDKYIRNIFKLKIIKTHQ